jgi:hypothetical protein
MLCSASRRMKVYRIFDGVGVDDMCCMETVSDVSQVTYAPALKAETIILLYDDGKQRPFIQKFTPTRIVVVLRFLITSVTYCEVGISFEGLC